MYNYHNFKCNKLGPKITKCFTCKNTSAFTEELSLPNIIQLHTRCQAVPKNLSGICNKRRKYANDGDDDDDLLHTTTVMT